ncbi:HTH-type transcriptional regulator MalT [Moritella sp. 24]|uniref:HTH-type transcriptional regulator MalT n=1 Tax=Moritella sp. 24 TaxID=2746230 RepID=UPI001BAE18A6|nr:HTH-type transcriptional regulator MalT [Moritella sp. 24]QUM77400.1 HTH-type transcriptional regulator MalT [Moritella sp. 24]
MWIASKLNRPSRLHNSISRTRVLTQLQDAPFNKLVLFRSPAGYGKTTMAAQWLKDQSQVGWFNIDETDNDTFRFVNYFIQAINKVTEQSCINSQALAERRQYSSLPNLFSELFAELAHYQSEFYLVLDDYHCINNDEIHEGLRFFLKYMPNNCTIVVTSRTLPPLNTANLRVRDQLIELDSEYLAFDDEEIVQFFQQRINFSISPEQVQAVQQKIEGWPSALQLIALQVKQKKHSLAESTEWLSQLNPSHLWDYLAEEVFNLLDKPLQIFLMQCSVFNIFNTSLITEFLDDIEANNLLESLDKHGLFLHSLEGEQNWYRFQNLFADFLKHQRRTKLAQSSKQLHKDAARAWLKHDNAQQALFHAQRAKDSALIADILSTHGWHMFNRGELANLETTIGQLQPDTLYQSPRLPLLQAWLAQSQHSYDQVGDLLAQALTELKQRNIELTRAQQGEFNALRAQVAMNQNTPKVALQLAENALEQLDPSNYRSRIVATSVIGEVNHVLGHLDRALSVMQQAERMARQYHVYPQALWTLLQQSEILIAQGHIQSAFELLDSADQLAEKQHLQQLPLYEFSQRIRSQIYWRWNHLDLAEEFAHKGLNVLPEYSQSKHLQSYAILARVHLSRGELDKAGRYIDLCGELIDQSDYHADWIANANFSQLLYWQAKGLHSKAEQWLTQSQPVAENACNHFTQSHGRNVARAYMLTENYTQALQTLDHLQQAATDYQLVFEQQKNATLEAVLYSQSNNQEKALEKLKIALTLANTTSSICDFLIDAKVIAELLNGLLKQGKMAELERYRAEKLLAEMSIKRHSRAVYFDKDFVHKLLNSHEVPELIRTSPLTHREWQVLGLIYSRYSNEQISIELDVASTTIKTHIRNLYQKLNIANRKEAIETAENLLKMIGY